MAIQTITVNGTTYRVDYDGLDNKPISKATVTIGTSWTGSGPYEQQISIQGATARTKVDLQPDATALSSMMDDGVTAMWVENDGGTLVAKAMGAAPSTSLTMQCTLTEVAS